VDEQRHGRDLDIALLAVIGVVFTLVLIAVVVAAQAYFYNSQEEEMIAKQLSQPSWELGEILAGQQAELHSYRWADREKQRVSIPIDQAMARYARLEMERAATRTAPGP
jgi:hypothetical protein